MSHQTHHKKKPEDDPEQMFTEAMEKELEKVPGVDAPDESGKRRISSTGEETELSEEEFRKLKLLS